MKRRRFIQQASCAAVGYTTLFSTLFNLKSISAAATVNSMFNDCNDYRALVCFVMNGGNDSYNMLVPFDGTPYTDYVTYRNNIALGNGQNGTPNEITEISPTTSQGRTLGMNHALSNMKTMFDDGELAFMANIGSLIEPIASASDFYSGDFDVPLGLYSHADQQKHWQTARPLERTNKGWGGTIADMIDTVNCNNTVSVNISLDGTNTFQTGNSSFSYVISPYDGSVGIQNYGNGNTFYNLRDVAMNNMMDHNYQDAFKNAYLSEIKDANDTHLLFSGAINQVSLTTPFGTSRISKSFEMIAKTIAAANMPNTGLFPMKRQIFYVDMGGFDNHDEVIATQEALFVEIDEALNSFNLAMKEISLFDKVTTFAISEFARTITSNGQGSDHGWGGNVFVMGGDVIGKDIYGTYPDLAVGTSLDLGGGVYVPQLSADEYFAELALWFGVSKTDLSTIFPNISNFYNVMSQNPPIGFMNNV